jgi:hypothetical protein
MARAVSRMTWLGAGAYLIAFLCDRSIAQPAFLVLLLLALLLRLVETVRFAAHTQEFD